MKQTILLIVFILFTLVANAQNFFGRIIDEQSQPMPFANVVLLNPADSTFIVGTVSKKDGTFSIQADCNEALLKVTTLGYKVSYINARMGNVGDIKMQPYAQSLGEIVVKGYRPLIKQEHEKTIFDLKNMPKIEALKAIDVMKFAPGVVVTSGGGIYVAGKNAAVFVNDRQLSGDELTAYLNSLKASDIERIEVMQSHGGENDANIQGGVVNIITKGKMLGFNGTVDFYASMPEKRYYDLTPTVNLFFGTKRWNLYGTYSYTRDKSKQYKML